MVSIPNDYENVVAQMKNLIYEMDGIWISLYGEIRLAHEVLYAESDELPDCYNELDKALNEVEDHFPEKRLCFEQFIDEMKKIVNENEEFLRMMNQRNDGI